MIFSNQVINSYIIIMYNQYPPPTYSYPPPNYSYELQQKQKGKFAQPLLAAQSSSIVLSDAQRSCTDTLCAILMLLFIGAFIGLLTYGLIKGNAIAVISVYNSNGTQCNQQPNNYYGYLPNLFNGATIEERFSNAVCVSQCPTSQGITMGCLQDQTNCAKGNFTSSYPSFALSFYCIPSNFTNTINIQTALSFTFDTFGAWIYDLQVGWIVLVSAALGAMILSVFYFLVVRCCAGPMVWLAIIVFIGGMTTIGVFFILQAKGITVSAFISENLPIASQNTLIVVGSSLLGASVLVLLLVICMKSRIAMGAKAVELGSIFLFQNCCLVILPITQALFILAAFAALVVGSGYLYSTGEMILPNYSAFAIYSLPVTQIVILSVYLAASLWVIFFLNGCNRFMLSSAVAIWYFNSGSPCCESLWRLFRFHSGSVAFTSLMNGIFFLIRIIANIFSFDVKQDDNTLVSCCLKCLNYLFCVFRIFLRFLSEGTYVQIAIKAQGYCSSTFKAFELLTDNAVKVSITDSLGLFFTVLGILGITLGISVGAYFSILYIPFYKQRISNAFVVTIVSGLISFVISAIYLSMIDGASSSILQCYLVDHQVSKGKMRYGNQSVRDILMTE